MRNILKYENPQYLELLWLILPAILIVFLFLWWRTRVIKRLGDNILVGRQIVLGKNYWLILKAAVLIMGLAMLIITLANPLSGAKPEKVKQEGLDIVLALDVSASMRAADLMPDRMARARQFSSRLVQQLVGSKIGIVVFAARAYIQMPLTTDPSAAQMYLSVVNTDMVQNQGTALGDALDKAQALLLPDATAESSAQMTSKVVLLMTDGENHEDDAFEKARELASNHIIVYTIGAGDKNGAPIPAGENSPEGEFLKDREGNVVTSKLDEAMLSQISEITGGSFYRLSDSETALDDLINQLGRLQTEEREVEVFLDYESKFQWFAGIALALFLLEYLAGLFNPSLRKND